MTGRCFWVDKSKKRVYDYNQNYERGTVMTNNMFYYYFYFDMGCLLSLYSMV